MATATAALRTPEDLANRYDRLAKSTGRTKTFYMTEALALLHDGGACRRDRQARIRVRPHELSGKRLVARYATVRA